MPETEQRDPSHKYNPARSARRTSRTGGRVTHPRRKQLAVFVNKRRTKVSVGQAFNLVVDQLGRPGNKGVEASYENLP
jgi:hypothetical protein